MNQFLADYQDIIVFHPEYVFPVYVDSFLLKWLNICVDNAISNEAPIAVHANFLAFSELALSNVGFFLNPKFFVRLKSIFNKFVKLFSHINTIQPIFKNGIIKRM